VLRHTAKLPPRRPGRLLRGGELRTGCCPSRRTFRLRAGGGQRTCRFRYGGRGRFGGRIKAEDAAKGSDVTVGQQQYVHLMSPYAGRGELRGAPCLLTGLAHIDWAGMNGNLAEGKPAQADSSHVPVSLRASLRSPSLKLRVRWSPRLPGRPDHDVIPEEAGTGGRRVCELVPPQSDWPGGYRPSAAFARLACACPRKVRGPLDF
jgi:hypothetical protein